MSMEAVTEQLAASKVDAPKGELSFAGRGLKLNTEQDAEPIVREIEASSYISALCFEGNTVGVNAAKAIAKALESHPELSRALWKDMFTGRLKTEIPDALRYLSSGLILAGARLSELDLSDNAFGPIGVEGLTELVKSKTCFTLKVLRLNNNGLGVNGGKLLAQTLMECFEISSEAGSPFALEVFVCGRNRLEIDGTIALAAVFKAICSLRELQMPQNGIYHQGVAAIADALKSNPSLRILNLNDNTLSIEGAEAIAQALPTLQQLEVLNLGDCLLKTDGAAALVKPLTEGHTKLKELILDHNEIGRSAAVDLVLAISDKQHLNNLNLNGNMIGSDGIEEMKTILLETNKVDALASLSEDEGDDDDDYEDEEDEEGIVSEITADDSSLTIIRDTPNNVSFMEAEECTACEFVSSASAAKLLGLGSQRGALLVAQAKKEENLLEMYVQIFMKVASVVTADSENIKNAAYQCTDALLKAAFEQAQHSDQVSVLSNYLIVHLGLIKPEDKKFQPITELRGAFLLLTHAVRQPYFSPRVKDVLQLFLNRPNKAVEATGLVKHKLMQAIYQY